MNIKHLVLSVVITTSAIASPYVWSEQVTTLNLTKDVLQAALVNPFGNFMNYRIEGVCFWRQRGPFGFIITPTLKVNEFLPDAVVDVYTNKGKNPWLYANKIVDPAMKAFGDPIAKQFDQGATPKSTNFSVGGGSNMMEKYKEVDVIGDPALTGLFSRINLTLIPSNAHPFEPYYSSLADSYLWRTPFIEDFTHPLDILPGRRFEGSLTDQWGSIFPRTGYIFQLGDYKAASVLALRALDIVTHQDQSHIYNSLPSMSCGSHCRVWPSHENDYSDEKFQEIYPVLSIKAKKVFGVNDVLKTTYGQKQSLKGHGNYLWVVWRHYEGCIQGDGEFVGEINS